MIKKALIEKIVKETLNSWGWEPYCEHCNHTIGDGLYLPPDIIDSVAAEIAETISLMISKQKEDKVECTRDL